MVMMLMREGAILSIMKEGGAKMTKGALTDELGSLVKDESRLVERQTILSFLLAFGDSR
jgi:hypothetical protein